MHLPDRLARLWLTLSAAVAIVAAFSPVVLSADRYWDTSNTAGLQGGSGSLNGSNWSTNVSGTGTRTTIGSGNDVFFQATEGSLTYTGTFTTGTASNFTINNWTVANGNAVTLVRSGVGTEGSVFLINGTILVTGSSSMTWGLLSWSSDPSTPALTISQSSTNTIVGNGGAASRILSFGALTFGTGSNALRFTQSNTNAVSGAFTSLSGAAGNSIFLERSNYSLTLNNTDASSFLGVISGSGSVTKQGSGSLTLGGANTYSGATAVTGGSLVFGAANVLADTSAVTIANATLATGSFSDTVASLTSGTGTINMTIAGGTVGSLTTTGALAFNGSNTLAVTLDNPTLGRYSLFNYTGSRTGTFSTVTGASDWNVVYGGGSNSTIDLQQKANQAWSVTLSSTRALVDTNVALAGLLTNTSGSGAASLTVSASSTGQLTVSSLPTGTIVGGSSAAVNASIAAGSTLGARTWTIVNTDANAITTSATATGTLTVVQNRTYTSPATIDLGRVLVGQSVSNQAVVSSTQSFATTATGTLGGSASSFNGISLTGSNFVFDGVLTAGTYALSGSVIAPAGTTIVGTYSLGSTNEFGDLTSDAASVSFTGTAIDPAVASFVSDSTSTLLTLDFGSVSQDSIISPLNFSIFNLVQTSGFTADLALYEIDTTQATNPEITTDLALFNNLAAGGSSLFNVSLSTATIGAFANTYVLRLKSANDGTIYSADTPQELTLVAKAVVFVPEPGALALAGIGLAGWIAARKRCRSRPSQTPPPTPVQDRIGGRYTRWQD